jgi:uncharacterized protein
VTTCSDSPSAELRRGIEQFNRREFFECHETLEAMWLAEPEPVRQLYQGVLQIGVGFYHLQRGNRKGGVKSLARGRNRLLELPSMCQGIEVHKLARDTLRALEWLLGWGPTGPEKFEERLIPKILLVESSPPATDISTTDK